jgi:hypothetical protein
MRYEIFETVGEISAMCCCEHTAKISNITPFWLSGDNYTQSYQRAEIHTTASNKAYRTNSLNVVNGKRMEEKYQIKMLFFSVGGDQIEWVAICN